MTQQLTEILNYFLNDYIQKKNFPFGKGAEVYKSICVSACDKIYETGLVNKEDYKVEGSVGQGNWAKVPWLAIFRKDITLSAQNGVYIVYLLSSDGNSLYLTLNQGVTEAGKDSTTKETIKALRNNADRISAQLNKHSFLSDENINLGNDITDLGKKYQKGTIFYKKYSKQNIPSEEILQEDLKNMLDIYQEYYDNVYKGNSNPSPEPSPAVVEVNMTKQKIFFGAPGMGKSHKIDYDLFKDKDGNSIGKGIKEIPENRKFRTTFHPDYDYAQFVGAYKPKKELNKTTNKEELTYSFVPQVFAKAYAAAWKLYLDAKGDSRLRGNDDKNGENDSGKDIQVYLVIEEINRGNCAQIFGDIFQLLDRDGEGFSQYSIDADCDFATWLKEDSILKTVWSEYETKVGDGKLKLPPNLNILATMNTSDQSLFPMDSAFKRRFDWEYVPISFDGKDAANYQIDIDGSRYSWQNFVEAVNEKILDLTESEDKQLGEFFIKPDSGNIISKERFLGKVMFYLWNEVCKDEHKNGSFFRAKINDKEDFFTFQDLYKNKDLLKQFMDELLAPKT